ncbi:unnamed protein product [Closterium sp. NIES-54]
MLRLDGVLALVTVSARLSSARFRHRHVADDIADDSSHLVTAYFNCCCHECTLPSHLFYPLFLSSPLLSSPLLSSPLLSSPLLSTRISNTHCVKINYAGMID